MNKIVLISAFLCSTLLAETVPTEMKFYGSKLEETNGKRITGDEVSKVHNFKLIDGGWDISYRPESIGSFFGLSDWIRLYYKGSEKGHGDNKEPKFIKIYGPDISNGRVVSSEEGKLIERKKMLFDLKEGRLYYNAPNPEYKEYNFEWKVFSGNYKNINIELWIYSDGNTVLTTDDGKFRITQELLDMKGGYTDVEQRRFMLGVYEHNK